MLELKRRHYPDPWGRPSEGEMRRWRQWGSWKFASITPAVPAEWRRSSAWPAGSSGSHWSNQIGELFGDWEPHDAKEPARRKPRPASSNIFPRIKSNADRHRLSQRSLPASRLFSGVGRGRRPQRRDELAAVYRGARERGLCYSVYASYHTHRDRGCVLCYAGTTAPRAQETSDVTLEQLRLLAQGSAGGVGAAEDACEKFVGDAARIELGAAPERWPAIGITWAASNAGRSGAIGGRVDMPRASTAIWPRIRPADFTIVTLGRQRCKLPCRR